MGREKVFKFRDGCGLYTKGYRDKKSATAAMRHAAESTKAENVGHWEDWYSYQPEEITEETVVETAYRQHRACETETVGDDDTCCDCGEPCGTNGRKTYAFFSKNA